jgi:phytanoyl-CoA hydroxylase
MAAAAPSSLTPAEVSHYREHGWVVASQFLARRMQRDPAQLVDHFMALHETVPHDRRYGGVDDEHEDSNHQWPRMINMQDGETAALASSPPLLAAVGELLNDEPQLHQTMVYFKPPRGRGQALHQDMAIITIDPLLGVWMPLDEATPEVGPMIVVDRSHVDGFAPKRHTDMAISFTEGEAIPKPVRENPGS